jgi:hypothetical protein
MKLSTVILFFFTTFFAYSQDQKGYYIISGGQRIDGYFKTSNFFEEQTLQFRDLDGTEYKSIPLANVIEYGINDQYKFQQHLVNVDNSKMSGKNISTQYKPEYIKRNLFLNVVVQGDASLFSAIYNGETKYFYSVRSKNIQPTQLIYKNYSSDNVTIKQNNSFRQELFEYVKCENDGIHSFAISYTKKDLITIFERYNTCHHQQYNIYTNNGSDEVKVKFTVFAGPNLSTLSVSGSSSETSSKVGVGFGGELAFIMPSKKVALFGRLEFENVNSQVSSGVSYTNRITEVYTLKANFVSLVLGPRFYITRKLFADAGLGIKTGFGDFTNERFIMVNSQPTLSSKEAIKINADLYFNLGLGYAINDKFGVDARYDISRVVVPGETKIKAGRLGVSLRYTLN